MISEIVGQNVKKKRKESGFSQEQLALAAGISPTVLRAIERGDGNPTVKTLGKLAEQLGITVDELTKKG